VRKPDFDICGGSCLHCGTRLPEWDTREHCDLCLRDCWEFDNRDAREGEDDDRGTDSDCD
jgi:hypothetical protein